MKARSKDSSRPPHPMPRIIELNSPSKRTRGDDGTLAKATYFCAFVGHGVLSKRPKLAQGFHSHSSGKLFVTEKDSNLVISCPSKESRPLVLAGILNICQCGWGCSMRYMIACFSNGVMPDLAEVLRHFDSRSCNPSEGTKISPH